MTPTDSAVQTEREIARADPEQAKAALDHYAATGDVSKMTNAQRAAFILYYCERLGLEPATGPVQIIEFYDADVKAKVAKIYVKAEAAKQIGSAHRIRVETLSEGMVGKGLYKVNVRGHDPAGRTYDEVGYVNLLDRDGNVLQGDRYKNKLMACHTIAKRRLILGMVGLSAGPEPDEARDVRRLYLGPSGELLDNPTEEDRYLNDNPKAALAQNRPRFDSLPQPIHDSNHGGGANLRPRVEDFEPPARPYQPPARFHCDAEKWRGMWFMLVKDTFLESDDARHDFIRWATSNRPGPLRTNSLSTFLAHATDRQAESLINLARETIAEQAAAHPPEPTPPVPFDKNDPINTAPPYPERPADGVTYSIAAWRRFYRDWAAELKRRDVSFVPMADAALGLMSAIDLEREVTSIIGEVDSADLLLSMADDDDDAETPF